MNKKSEIDITKIGNVGIFGHSGRLNLIENVMYKNWYEQPNYHLIVIDPYREFTAIKNQTIYKYEDILLELLKINTSSEKTTIYVVNNLDVILKELKNDDYDWVVEELTTFLEISESLNKYLIFTAKSSMYDGDKGFNNDFTNHKVVLPDLSNNHIYMLLKENHKIDLVQYYRDDYDFVFYVQSHNQGNYYKYFLNSFSKIDINNY